MCEKYCQHSDTMFLKKKKKKLKKDTRLVQSIKDAILNLGDMSLSPTLGTWV